MRIYLNTWKNYNENGSVGGKWIELGVDIEVLREEMVNLAKKLGENDPEFFINDYDENEFGDVGIYPEENDNIIHLNEKLQDFNQLTPINQRKVLAVLEVDCTYFGYAIFNDLCKRGINDIQFYNSMKMIDVAYELVQEEDLPEFALKYFNYKAYANDLSMSGYDETAYGVIRL